MCYRQLSNNNKHLWLENVVKLLGVFSYKIFWVRLRSLVVAIKESKFQQTQGKSLKSISENWIDLPFDFFVLFSYEFILCISQGKPIVFGTIRLLAYLLEINYLSASYLYLNNNKSAFPRNKNDFKISSVRQIYSQTGGYWKFVYFR